MIEFNLLPDVKLEFIKAQRTKRLVMSISFIASAAALALLILLILSVDVVQKKSLDDVNRDVSTYTQKLKSSPQLSKVLTVQNQLGALTTLHDQKASATRLFGYLTQVTPAQATISNISIDFTQNTMTITGNANTLDTVNTFVDTLKFTTYTTESNSTPTKAFTQVVLSSFSVPTSKSGASYTITLSFDPTIFSNTSNVTLTVPQTVTTRSVTDQPTDLFKTQTSSK
jgi:Tfp pilus assembly protein PilN